MIIRDYQSESIEFLIARRRGFIIAPAGSGKTVIGANAVARRAWPGCRVLWLANTREQVEQAVSAIERTEGGPDNVSIEVCCVAANPDTSKVDIVVVDECFVAGTLVEGRPIESIQVGDVVSAYDHANGRFVRRRVVKTFKNRPSGNMVRLETRSGRILYCTEGHPIYVVGRGYVPAGKIKPHDPLVCASGPLLSFLLVPRLPETVGKENGAGPFQGVGHGPLQHGLLTGIPGKKILGNDGKDESKICFGTDDRAESDALSRVPGQDGQNASADRPPSADSGRERTGADGPTEDLGRSPRTSVGHGTPDFSRREASEHAYLLQGGSGEPGPEDRGGGRRNVASGKSSEDVRPEEDTFFGVDRVESVKILEPGSPNLPGDGFVYNLQVDEHPSYLADGILVHNCHHVPAASWSAIVDRLRAETIVWGLSATPYGPDPERNAKVDDTFKEYFTIGRERVLASGHLVEGKVFVHDIDADGEFDAAINAATEVEVKRRMRCFRNIQKFEHERRAKWQITQEAVQANAGRNALAVHLATSHASRGESVLLLVHSIEHGQTLVDRIPGSVIVHSKLAKKARAAAIEGLRNGSIKVLVATSLADEGLDVPRASVLVLVAGGRSAAKLEQRAGRVLRPFEGKQGGVIHDFLDRGAAFALSQARARFRVYEKLGYNPELVDPRATTGSSLSEKAA